jgi:prolipoprotein diacylglyceryltransferase
MSMYTMLDMGCPSRFPRVFGILSNFFQKPLTLQSFIPRFLISLFFVLIVVCCLWMQQVQHLPVNTFSNAPTSSSYPYTPTIYFSFWPGVLYLEWDAHKILESHCSKKKKKQQQNTNSLLWDPFCFLYTSIGNMVCYFQIYHWPGEMDMRIG